MAMDMRETGPQSVASVTPKSSFSAVCSPPLALMYRKKKGKPSFTLQDIDLDEELCDALCKISKSSEELWKEITPPSPITSKVIHTSEWMSMDTSNSNAAASSSSSSTISSLSHHSRVDTGETLPDAPVEAFVDPMLLARYQSHVNARGATGGRTSSSSSTQHIAPLKPTAMTPPPPSSSSSPSHNMLPPSSSIASPIPALHHSLHPNDVQAYTAHMLQAGAHLPSVFSPAAFLSAFQGVPTSFHIPTSPSNAPTSMDAAFMHTPSPSVTSNTIPISGNMNMTLQNPSPNHPSSLPPASAQHLHALAAAHMVACEVQSSFKTSARKGVQYPTPQYPQYIASNEDFSTSTQNVSLKPTGSVSPDKTRQRENEKLWSDVVLGCNKLMGHAARGAVQPLPWGEFNDSMNSARQIMTSLVSLLHLNSYAYANIYSSVAGYPGMQIPEDVSNPFARFQQFDPFGAQGLVSNMNIMNMGLNVNNMTMPTVETKKEPRDESVLFGNTALPQQFSSSYAFDEGRRKLPRRNSASIGLQTRSRDPSPDSSSNSALSYTPLVQSSSLPNIALSPVISALSNLTPMQQQQQQSQRSSPDPHSNSDPSIGAGNLSDDASSSNTSGTPEGASKNSNWKKSRGKKRSKYSELDLMCLSCGVKQTPEWRRGPAGAKTLCNACGLHWAKVLKAEGKAGAGDAKKAYLLEQKRHQFMMLAKRQDADSASADADSPPRVKSEPAQ